MEPAIYKKANISDSTVIMEMKFRLVFLLLVWSLHLSYFPSLSVSTLTSFLCPIIFLSALFETISLLSAQFKSVLFIILPFRLRPTSSPSPPQTELHPSLIFNTTSIETLRDPVPILMLRQTLQVKRHWHVFLVSLKKANWILQSTLGCFSDIWNSA